MSYHFHTGERAAADELVKRFHYSGKHPASVVIVGTWHLDGGLFGDSGECVAACYFGHPAARWSEPVLELCRLVRREDFNGALTGLISRTVKHIKRYSIADLLVSFADATQGHHGGIYQASSWNYDGQRKRRLDGFIVAGQFIPARNMNHTYGTSSTVELVARGIAAEPHYDDGKHLYWLAVNKDGRRKADRLGLRCLPYPKPQQRVAA